jgi:hypothetical protein
MRIQDIGMKAIKVLEHNKGVPQCREECPPKTAVFAKARGRNQVGRCTDEN